jgi:hypothetical protein
MTARKQIAAGPAVQEATKRASIPKRPVIEHTKLFRASLQLELQAANAALAVADRDLTNAAAERDEAEETAQRAYDASVAFARQRFDTIRTQVDAERDDILREINGIEAAMDATTPASNVVPMTAAAE